MGNGSENPATGRRRDFIKAVGAVGIVGISGCTGSDDNEPTATETGGSGGNGATETGTSMGNTDSGRWPDLSGEEIHILTESDADDHRTFHAELAQSFNELTGAAINWEYVGAGQGGNQRVAQLVQAGAPPELYKTTQADTSTFVNNGIAEPVTDVVEQAIETHGELPDELRLTFDGDDYQVPGWHTALSFYYRDDVSDIVPDTWEKQLQYAQEVNESESDLFGTYVPASSHTVQSHAQMGYVFSKDGSVVEWNNDQIEVAYDSGSDRQKFADILNHRRALHNYGPDARDAGFFSWVDAVPTGVAASGTYIGFRPMQRVWRQGRDFAENVKALPGGGIPEPPDGRKMSQGGILGYTMFKNSNTRAAKAFLEYLYVDRYLDFSTTIFPGHYIPTYQGFKNSDEYMDGVLSVYDERGLQIPEEAVSQYLSTAITSRPNDTDPPNPYTGVSVEATPFFDLISAGIIRKDTNVESLIDQYAPDHQAQIDQAQQ